MNIQSVAYTAQLAAVQPLKQAVDPDGGTDRALKTAGVGSQVDAVTISSQARSASVMNDADHGLDGK